MSAEGVGLKLSDDVAADLAALDIRAGRLTRVGGRVLAGAAILTAVALLTYGAVGNETPRTVIDAIHLPSEILGQFSNAPSGLHSGGALAGALFGTVQALLTGIVPKTLALVILLIGVIMSGLSARIEPLVKAIPASLVLFLPGLVLPVLFGSVDVTSATSERQKLVALAEAVDIGGPKSVERLSAALEGTKNIPLQHYVSAQALLKRADISNAAIDQKTMHELADHVSKVDDALVADPGLDVEPAVLYALEVRVLGEPKSTLAKTYHEEASSSRVIARRIGWGAGAAALLTALAGACLLGLGMRMRIRLRGILPLVDSTRRAEPAASSKPQVDLNEEVGLDWVPPHRRPKKKEREATVQAGPVLAQTAQSQLLPAYSGWGLGTTLAPEVSAPRGDAVGSAESTSGVGATSAPREESE